MVRGGAGGVARRWRRTRTWMRQHPAARWALSLLGGAVVLVGLMEASGWRLLRVPVEAVLARSIGAPVRLSGQFHARLLLDPRLEVQGLRVAAPAGFELPHLLQAEEVLLRWRWADLWRARSGAAPLRIHSLTAHTLDARLVRLADGRTSWSLGRSQAPAPEGRPASSPWPQFGLLRVDRGRLLFEDVAHRTQLVVGVQGGEGAAWASAQGRSPGYAATIDGHYRASELHLRVQARSALPLFDETGRGQALAPHVDPADGLVPLRVEGSIGAARLLFDGAAAALLGDRPLQGRVELAGPSLAAAGEPFGLTLPATPAFDLRGWMSHRSGLWELKAQQARIGRSELGGHFLYDLNARPARLQGQLRGRRLVLADLAPATGARSPAGAPAASLPGKVLPRRSLDLSALGRMDAQVEVALDELDLGQARLRPLQALSGQVVLRSGVLRLQDLRAQVAGGSVRGSTQLEASSRPAQWAAALEFERIDLAQWLQGFRVRQGRRSTPYISGVLAGQLDFAGRGDSTALVLGSLQGRARLMVRDGTLSHLVVEMLGLDVAQALGVLARGDRSLPLRCARLEVEAEAGRLSVRQAVMDTPDTTLRATGQLDLGSETLDLRAVARPKDFSPLSLRAPITVTGSLAAPRLSVQAGPMAGKAAGAVILGAVAGPLAALLPLVDPGEGSAQDPCAPLKPTR